MHVCVLKRERENAQECVRERVRERKGPIVRVTKKIKFARIKKIKKYYV